MLQQLLKEELGKKNIEKKELPDYLETSLSPARKMRPYQADCLRYFLSYMEDYEDRLQRPHLLFHMATGSGKTLVMAATMLYLYEKGYRNFLFFVDTNNIVEKTKDNFLNAASSKYLFAPQIAINGKRVEIRQVENFQGASIDCINLCLTTIQGLHVALNSNKENAPTYEDFSDQPIVLISDEAHHMNSDTKKILTKEEETSKSSWEATVKRIFSCNNGQLPNVLLEFTATADLDDTNIAKKYEDKIIYDYPLKKFREDKYSKEVMDVVSDLSPIDRAIQAIVLSQYKRQLFGSIRQNVKPVVMFKSKTISENKAFYDEFIAGLNNLSVGKLEKIKGRANGGVKAAFEHFDTYNVSLESLMFELQEEFNEERLLLVDGNNINAEKQQMLNSLEENGNQVRAIFAVDMLNEGWDVLNLYDIVRLYDTRDAKDGKPGKTTMQEAQLIGRGARYMPFADPKKPTLPMGMRKYDDDIENNLRQIETLHYHCANNPRYIQELHTALIKTGIKASDYFQRDLFFKDGFLEQDLYKKGVVFKNERIPVAQCEDDGTIGSEVKSKTFIVKMPTGMMNTGNLFGDDVHEALISETATCRFYEVGVHIIRYAINCYPTFYFDNLKRLYPSLRSVSDFIYSANYLHNLNVKIIGCEQCVEAYSQKDKLFIAKDVLRQLEPLLNSRGKNYRGTKLFTPTEFKNTFRKKITLNFAKQATDSNQEFGVSMKDSHRPDLRADLLQKEWYAYNDCFGTSEEKALIKYIEGIRDKLLEKYKEFYLIRNENDLKIFSFKTGAPFEPDFILFLLRKGKGTKYDNLQIFIEPKGENLRKQDAWKEEFLLEIKTRAEVQWCTSSNDFNVWGVPFFTEQNNEAFYEAFKQEIIDDTIPCGLEVDPEDGLFHIVTDISASDRFTRFLPLYSIKAACGPHEHNFSEEGLDNDLGWIEASKFEHKLNKNMFVVQAIGRSMEPKIYSGDYCVFERYTPETAGSRDGKIVLAKDITGFDDDYSGSFTIKQYHRVSDGKVELRSINDGHPTFTLEPNEENENNIPILAVFVGKLQP
ncbi:MAG: DEAD/DEAH box helicase family protein [Paludibacteraceae bacterium]|nr:DEAD/DEAH box helicase family protein [Paludibacteraceae bacterium]